MLCLTRADLFTGAARRYCDRATHAENPALRELGHRRCMRHLPASSIVPKQKKGLHTKLKTKCLVAQITPSPVKSRLFEVPEGDGHVGMVRSRAVGIAYGSTLRKYFLYRPLQCVQGIGGLHLEENHAWREAAESIDAKAERLSRGSESIEQSDQLQLFFIIVSKRRYDRNVGWRFQCMR